MMPLDSNDIEHLDEHLTQFDYGDHNVQLMRDALTELKELRANDALMKLSAMLRLGEPVRPDIHANMVRQRNELRDRLSALEAENERLRAEVKSKAKWNSRVQDERARRVDELLTVQDELAAKVRERTTDLNTALSDLARVREECELVREAMRQAQQTATRRLDECDRMRPSDEIFETGRWYACTGCHESDEGHPTGTYNAALRCHVGGGCFECGGIGARWEQFDEDALTPKEP
jgi:predicted nuclease with TOPRIM domain